MGRARNVDVCLPLARLSQYHGYFSELEAGRYAFTDTGSTHGTLVNGTRLARKVTSPLQDGVEITLGPYRFVFHGPDAFCDLVARRAQLR
ncbi:MAG: FHA domain-containing protein [Polyangiaceae bacterium]|nr:FHA domain-containing protein [Polyangiaceae bacterium]